MPDRSRVGPASFVQRMVSRPVAPNPCLSGWVRVCLLVGLYPLIACSSTSFLETGESSRPTAGRVRENDVFDLETIAMPRPLITAQPPDVLTGRSVLFVVSGHGPISGGFRLTLGPEVGEAVYLDYRIGQSERLPIEVGERLAFRLVLDDRQEPVGLVVRDEDQTLRVLVALSQDVSALPETSALGITADFSTGSLIYSEAVAVMTCLVELDHHPLRVADGTDRVSVRPGTSRVIDLMDTRSNPRVTLRAEEGALPYALLVLDVSRPTRALENTDGRCPQRAHVSWVLMRLE